MNNAGRDGGKRMWEDEMLGEYLAAYHPLARVINRVRLGPHVSELTDTNLSDSEKKLLGSVFRRWADAVVIEPDRALVVETKLIPDPRDVGQLLTYLVLFRSTPELQPYWNLPLKGVLVWGVDDEFTRIVAVRAGLEVRVFKPSNFLDYLVQKRQQENAPRKAQPAVVRASPSDLAGELARVLPVPIAHT